MAILVFDIETIPDVDAGKKLYGLDGLIDEDIAKAMFMLRREKTGSDFLPHYLQKIVAISLVLYNKSKLRVWSLGDETSNEKDLIASFFREIDKYTPTLVSWNGRGFDLPVLHYRALLHKISANVGKKPKAFHWKHLDLMDSIACNQNKAFAPLDELAKLLGFPGKMGMSGSQVWEAYLASSLKSIRDYCETDVLNTFCIYLRFELLYGNLDEKGYEVAIENLKTYLISETQKTHFLKFLSAM